MNISFLKAKISHVSRGFSLPEMLIVVALTIMLLFVLVNFFFGFSKVFRYIEANFSVTGSASTFVETLSNATRQSTGLVTSRTFSGTSYTTNSTTIILKLPTINSSGNIVSGSYDYMLFYKSGTNLYWVTDANGSSARPSVTKKLSETAQSLTLTYDNGDVTQATKVDIDVQTTKTIKTETINQHVHNQVYLRNK